MKTWKKISLFIDWNILLELLIIIEMAVGMLALGIFFSEIISMRKYFDTYHSMGLENVCFFYGDETTKDKLLQLIDGDDGIDYIGKVYGNVYANVSGKNVNLSIVSRDYFSWYEKKVKVNHIEESTPGGLDVYIMNDQWDKENDNNHCTIKFGGNEAAARLAGTLENAINFWPEEDFIRIISQAKTKGFLVIEETNQQGISYLSDTLVIYVLDFSDSKKMFEITEKTDHANIVKIIEPVSTMAEEYKEYTKKTIRIPALAGAVMSVMFAVGFSTLKKIQMKSKQSTFGVLFMCGVSWKKCVLFQGILDILILLLGMLAAYLLSEIVSVKTVFGTLNIEGLFWAAGICTVMYLLISVNSLIKMKKYNPIDAIRGTRL